MYGIGRGVPGGGGMPPRGSMLPVLAIHTAAEFYRLRRKPPVTAALLAANVLIYVRPGLLHSILPYKHQVFFNPYLIAKHKDLKRFFLSPFYHLNEPHLVYNMMSLLWKGIQLENAMGSVEFASMVAALLGMSQGITFLLAKSLLLFFDYERAYYNEYVVGFSGVLFAMKVVLNSQSDYYTIVHGLIVPARLAAWAELVLIQMFVPGVSFLTHLGGILAGILYLRLKSSSSGSDPLAGLFRGIGDVLSWPVRHLQGLFRSRRWIFGRGTIGEGQTGLANPGMWRCQACTFNNSGWLSVCEMCGTSCDSDEFSIHQFSNRSHYPLEEVRRRRMERFGG